MLKNRSTLFMHSSLNQQGSMGAIRTSYASQVTLQFSALMDDIFFAGLPRHFPLRRKIAISRSRTSTGAYWDMAQIAMALLSCIIYVYLSYGPPLHIVKAFWVTVIVMTAFFILEMLLTWFVSGTGYFILDPFTYLDLATLVPFVVGMYAPDFYDVVSILICLRAIRTAKIFKSFKLTKNMTNVRKQVISLSVTIFCVSFLAAAIMQELENELVNTECKDITEKTGWEPSCSPDTPSSELMDCNCESLQCRAYYRFTDSPGEPSRVKCRYLSFFNSFYFVVVTITSVGYGDIKPSSDASKVFVIIFVVAFFLVIPMSISKLQQLLSLTSPFRTPYLPQAGENHIVVCGHVNDSAKLFRFFSEFFHADRTIEEEFHAVVLCPQEPSEEVRALLQTELLVSRCTYVIGTAMAVEDLKRVHAERARCMFFLCNSEITDGSKEATETEDAATVLRALSVSNYKPGLECLVQVLRPEERVILRDSDVDCILCLDEYKTLLQARNAVCPGFSTFVESLFRSVEEIPPDKLSTMPPWYSEYLHGATMELYFFELPPIFISHCQYDFKTMAEMIYLKFGVMMLAVGNETWDSIIFQPHKKDLERMEGIGSMKDFFKAYHLGMVMARDQQEAESIGRELSRISLLRELTISLGKEEEAWSAYKTMIDYKAKMRGAIVSSSSANHSMNYMLNYYKKAAVGVGFDYTECESDDDDELMNTVSTTYIGYSSYRGRVKRTEAQEDEAGLASTTQGQMKGPPISKLRIRDNSSTPGTSEAPKLKLEPNRGAMKKDQNVTVSEMAERERHDYLEYLNRHPGVLGRPSGVIETAQHLSNHVIIYGHNQYTNVFLSELRRPAVVGPSYHPIVIIADDPPQQWDVIKSTYNDVYFLRSGLTRGSLTSKANAENAFSMIFLTTRDTSQNAIDNKGLDAVTLFAFLKIMQGIPKTVFCSIELSSAGNMSVLNATIVKRLRRQELDDKLASLRRKMMREKSSAAKASIKAAKAKKDANNRRNLSGTSARRSFAIKQRSNSIVGTDDDEKMLKEEAEVIQNDNLEYRAEKMLWEQVDNYNIFPVYASARVFVPSSFETLLVQSFYIKLTPLICEKFVCGQLGQTFQQADVPIALAGRQFLDLYRLFLANNVLCMGLYRSPIKHSGALIPYVFISPPPDAIVYEDDKIFVFGSHQNINRALCQADFIRGRHSRFI